jgi:hypothetical protein
MEEENRNEREPFNDEWLTRALRARSQAEARPGLEERILARLASEHEGKPQRASRWRWMPALALAFGLLLIVLAGREFLRLRPNSRERQVDVARPTRELQPRSDMPAVSETQVAKADGDKSKHLVHAQVRKSVHPVLAKTSALPKLDRFPADKPATEQERLLARFLETQEPAQLVQYTRRAQPDRLVIEPLRIDPIDLGNIPN